MFIPCVEEGLLTLSSVNFVIGFYAGIEIPFPDYRANLGSNFSHAKNVNVRMNREIDK